MFICCSFGVLKKVYLFVAAHFYAYTGKSVGVVGKVAPSKSRSFGRQLPKARRHAVGTVCRTVNIPNSFSATSYYF